MGTSLVACASGFRSKVRAGVMERQAVQCVSRPLEVLSVEVEATLPKPSFKAQKGTVLTSKAGFGERSLVTTLLQQFVEQRLGLQQPGSRLRFPGTPVESDLGRAAVF